MLPKNTADHKKIRLLVHRWCWTGHSSAPACYLHQKVRKISTTWYAMGNWCDESYWKVLWRILGEALKRKRHWKFIIFWFFSFEVRDGAAQKKVVQINDNFFCMFYVPVNEAHFKTMKYSRGGKGKWWAFIMEEPFFPTFSFEGFPKIWS